MKLTPFAKVFITVVVLAVLGYAVWHYKGDAVRRWAGADAPPAEEAESVEKDDFAALGDAPADPERGIGATGVTASTLAGSGKLSRPQIGRASCRERM